MEGIFPASREQLWRVLKLHTEDDQIGKIHPNLLSQRQVSSDGKRLLGKTYTFTMAVDMTPPDFYRWEIVSSDGLLGQGSFVENRYSEAGEGTKVSSTIDMTLKGVPGFLQSWMIKRNLNQVDDEDLKYLRKTQT
jgi:hypothetical protein